jgi:hypothetical protein
MVNHIPKYNALVILAEREPHDLAVELKRFPCTRLSINGTPDNLKAASGCPEIEDVSLRGCEISDLGVLKGLSQLRRLRISFGSLASLDLRFCNNTLEFLALSRLRRIKDLSTLPAMPKLEHLVISHIHSFTPPNFQLFPNLRHLSVWNTDWDSLSWLAHLPFLETLHISQIKVKDKNWKPILELQQLHHLHGMKSAFKNNAFKEFLRIRPDVFVDQGIPVDLDRHPQTKEFLETLHRNRN